MTLDQLRTARSIVLALAFVAIAPLGAFAEGGKKSGGGDAEALARQLQDPLANMAALMTDNTISFGQGNGNGTGFEFQLQPIYSIPTKAGFTLIPRAIIPIVGAPGGSDFPRLGAQRSPGNLTWGLSDIITQLFITPDSKGAFKWGAGPMVSLRTRTNTRVGGPGWGGGPAALVVYSVDQWGLAGIAGHLWGQKGFSTSFVQPMIYYNLKSLSGAYVAYNNTITADWNASSSNRWSVPVGLTVGRAFSLGNGYGLDLSVGGYHLAVRPNGGPKWQLKVGVTLVFPR